MSTKTCVTPNGSFKYGIHEPSFTAHNLRPTKTIQSLGSFPDGTVNDNKRNFPDEDVIETQADTIYEIPNPFPFRGTTYIAKSWAENKAKNPESISLPKPLDYSFSSIVNTWFGEKAPSSEKLDALFKDLPEQILLTLAATSTDPSDLVRIANSCCEFDTDPKTHRPTGLKYRKEENGRIRAIIHNHPVFETLANNNFLPDDYKEVMVLRPGAQGGSEIMGEYQNDDTHIFEYLRRNSYIPWGHYAANMANDAIRYSINDLSASDMRGLRHLYYQRTFVRLAKELNINLPNETSGAQTISREDIETLRKSIQKKHEETAEEKTLIFNAPLWGWNYGFDFAPSKYRLHASHQQIHQQFAMLPASVQAKESNKEKTISDNDLASYGCGDLVTDFIMEYRKKTGQEFFDDYIKAIRTNTRMDENPNKESSLVVFEDENVIVFVPKAQTSQWELQLMPVKSVGNILEADSGMRDSLDTAILVTMKILISLGAKMVTTIEFPKRFDSEETGQHLLYSFLPRLPESPGAFSEAQLRWINGHYPEDFAISCRNKLPKILEMIKNGV